MKAIKYISGLLLVALLITNCDSREDYFLNVNQAPVINLKLNDSEIDSYNDSIKIGHAITFDYEIVDEEELSLIVNNGESFISSQNDDKQVSFTGTSEGKSTITIKATDSFNESTEKELKFTVFDNLSPVTNFSVTTIGIYDPNEIEVDATASYDLDARFGGKIDLYEYTLDSYKFQSTLSKVKYIFGSSGQKKITVRVRDNNGDWSAEKSITHVLM